jgi:predicted ATPase
MGKGKGGRDERDSEKSPDERGGTCCHIGRSQGTVGQISGKSSQRRGLSLCLASTNNQEEIASVKTYAQIQEQLSKLVGLPQNLPIVYLLGDTGAGKTCLVSSLLKNGPFADMSFHAAFSIG